MPWWEQTVVAETAAWVAETADYVAETAGPVAETAGPVAETANSVAETAVKHANPVIRNLRFWKNFLWIIAAARRYGYLDYFEDSTYVVSVVTVSLFKKNKIVLFWTESRYSLLCKL